MCGYNFLADGKSKAGSVFLMCDKKVKESRQILGGDSAASVLHTDGQKVTVETERDFDRSAGRHCFRRISDQVQKKLTKLRGIKGKARNGRFLDKFNGNLLFFEENAGIGTEILEQKIRIHVSAYRPILMIIAGELIEQGVQKSHIFLDFLKIEIVGKLRMR